VSSSWAQHERHAAAHREGRPVRCAVLTVSDTRTAETDHGGPLIERLLAESGHETTRRALVADEAEAISGQIERWLGDRGIEAILITGGTGITARDNTTDVVRPLLTVEIEGFGELFRMLSYRKAQAAAMLSRAVGGLVVRPASAGGETFLFAMPGSTDAVETAVGELIAPQLGHLVWLRQSEG
jgi:molybdenum cofactor biosynthesis protein B